MVGAVEGIAGTGEKYLSVSRLKCVFLRKLQSSGDHGKGKKHRFDGALVTAARSEPSCP